MTRALTVAVAEDHIAFRRELVVLLERDPLVEVVAEAADLDRLGPRLSVPPSLVLADASAPGGDVARAIARFATPGAPPVVVILGPGDDPVRPLLAGAAGAVSKGLVIHLGAELLRRVPAGIPLVGPEAGQALLRLARQVGHRLDERQEDLLRQLAGGRDAPELAGRPGDAPGETDRILASTIMDVRAAVHRNRRAPTVAGVPADPVGPVAPGNPAARRQ